MIIAAVLILSIGAYVTFARNPVPALKVSVTLLDGSEDTLRDRWNPGRNAYDPYIDDIALRSTVERTTVVLYGSPTDDPLDLPGVVLRAFVAGRPASTWASVPYGGPGSYALTVLMTAVPDPGTVVSLNLEVVDETGEDMYPFFVEDMANSVIHYEWA